ncbi:MAG: hypothetical protein GY795_05640 [Desulfobacterales bacterium]|nr:hypothetical protein [Desulfobacterales bacterium]
MSRLKSVAEKSCGSDGNIKAGRDVAYSKGHDRPTVVKNSNVGVIGDNASVGGGINKGEEGMEPISVGVITGALASGALVAAKDLGKTAVKDAYDGLKSLIQRLFSEKNASPGEMALTEYDKDAEAWEKPLQKYLAETGADSDEKIINAVKTLLEVLKDSSEGNEALSKYNLKDCEVGATGDHMTIHGGIQMGGSKK